MPFSILVILVRLLLCKIVARFRWRWGIMTSGSIWLRILCFGGRGFLRFWGHFSCRVSNISLEHFEGQVIRMVLFRCLGFLMRLIGLKGVLKDLS